MTLSLLAASAVIRTTAAAPSFSVLALAAVTVPEGINVHEFKTSSTLSSLGSIKQFLSSAAYVARCTESCKYRGTAPALWKPIYNYDNYNVRMLFYVNFYNILFRASSETCMALSKCWFINPFPRIYLLKALTVNTLLNILWINISFLNFT